VKPFTVHTFIDLSLIVHAGTLTPTGKLPFASLSY